jgi:hypothetical protein
MPQKMCKSGRGFTSWDPTRTQRGQSQAPRLFDSRRLANNARNRWLEGVYGWESYGEPWEGHARLDARNIPGRNAEDVEVVPLLLMVAPTIPL